MRDIRPSAEYMNEIMHQVKVSTSISPMISEMLRSVRISSVSEIYERYSSIMDTHGYLRRSRKRRKSQKKQRQILKGRLKIQLR